MGKAHLPRREFESPRKGVEKFVGGTHMGKETHKL